MKKTKFILVASLLLLTSCNKQAFDFNYKFTKVHIYSENKCYNITSRRDYDDGEQIQVDIENYGKHLFHANQIILVEDKCVICEKVS